MSKPDLLSFDPGFDLLPIGLPTTGWQSESGAMKGDNYVVTADGRLLFSPDTAADLSFRSDDASGELSLVVKDATGLVLHRLSVRFYNGKIVDVGRCVQSSGFKWQPTWVLNENPFTTEQLDIVEELISIIRICNSGRDHSFQTESIRLMVGLALCRDDLLLSTPAAKAWQMLSTDQINAITTWWH